MSATTRSALPEILDCFCDDRPDATDLPVPAVVCYPWQDRPYVESFHRTQKGAIKAAREARRAFSRQYPNGYGWTWDACLVYQDALGRYGDPHPID